MKNIYFILIATLVVLVVFYIYGGSDESFFIEQNTITSGDYHAQIPGAIADAGSFANVMGDYEKGDGQI